MVSRRDSHTGREAAVARGRAPFARASGARAPGTRRRRGRAREPTATVPPSGGSRRVHLTITRVGPHVERRALPRGRARRRRAGNALRKPFAFGRVPGDGKGAGMTSRTRARGFSFPGWRCFGHCGDLIGQRGSTTREGFFYSSGTSKPRLQKRFAFFRTGDPMKPHDGNASTTDQLGAFQNSRVHIDNDADARNATDTIDHPPSSTSSTPGLA